eukprot:1218428-Amorphochlora_amoeboformis.AAC.1
MDIGHGHNRLGMSARMGEQRPLREIGNKISWFGFYLIPSRNKLPHETKQLPQMRKIGLCPTASQNTCIIST